MRGESGSTDVPSWAPLLLLAAIVYRVAAIPSCRGGPEPVHRRE